MLDELPFGTVKEVRIECVASDVSKDARGRRFGADNRQTGFIRGSSGYSKLLNAEVAKFETIPKTVEPVAIYISATRLKCVEIFPIARGKVTTRLLG